VLREVLSNLLVNALEVMPAGGNIRLDAMADPARVRVTVADDGPGLDNETARRIFEPGFTSREGDFRGIGLAGSRQLLKCFDGRLELATGHEPGAAFVLDLPLAPPPPSGPAEPAAPTAAGTAVQDVLVVDDESGVREMLTDVLTTLGCRVTAARNAAEGLEAFGTGDFDLALLDQSLPGRSGLDLAGDLRERDPHLVVVLVSGWGQEEVLAGADPAVVDLTADKPLPWERIREILAQAAEIHQQRKDHKG
jgi:CheY-like chemotaxis protein